MILQTIADMPPAGSPLQFTGKVTKIPRFFVTLRKIHHSELSMKLKKLLISCMVSMLCGTTSAQLLTDNVAPLSVSDSLLAVVDTVGFEPVVNRLPVVVFLPAVYTGYDRTIPSTQEFFNSSIDDDGQSLPLWLRRVLRTQTLVNMLRQSHNINAPWQVPYNIKTMAAPPKQYVATVDPNTAATIFEEIGALPGGVDVENVLGVEAQQEVRKQHWLNKFTSLIQFSQAFVSPNWYQGGNNSLNLIADFTYNTKLNPRFHPKLMFENFFQWRTALASTPDDEYRPYSLTENRFQINSKFGYKAIYNWYYSFQGVFKTPIFRGYKNNSMTRTASFLSPGELNIGIGMTYNMATKNKKFDLSLSISPLSYNLKTVIDKEIDEVSQGLEKGHKTLSQYGSSIEANWNWKICYNVAWHSRFFFFTDYSKYQYDWQNRFEFTINRFLSANLNVDMRYDTTMNPTTSWKKMQLREIFSLGFTYTINRDKPVKK